MTKSEIIEVLEEAMDLDEGTLAEDTELADFEEWDSLAKLSLMAAVKKQFSVGMSADNIKSFVTVADVCEFLKAE